jgi:hypothetical protein
MTDRSPARIQVNPDVVFRVLGDGAVLVNLADNQVYELNETGAAAWSKLADGLVLDQIAEQLSAEFDVEPPEARARLEALVEELRRASLIE